MIILKQPIVSFEGQGENFGYASCCRHQSLYPLVVFTSHDARFFPSLRDEAGQEVPTRDFRVGGI